MYPTGRAGKAAGSPQAKESKKRLKAKVGLAENPQIVEIEVPENEFDAGNGAAMVDTLSAVRADSTGNGGFNLPALADPGSTAGQVDLLFRERAFWLFATGHRLGDMRRLVRQYGRAVDSVFPNGAYFKGGNYGTDVNIPVPFQETNNPNFQGCLNRDP